MSEIWKSDKITAEHPRRCRRRPAGRMICVREAVAKGNKYRETPVLLSLATTIRTIDDVREESSDA